MPRLKNPFAKYQTEKIAGRKELITNYLGTLRRTRAKYQYVTDLAKGVAEQIELSEKKPCSPSTLLRNKHYKALLLHFMASQSGTALLNSSSVTDNIAKHLLNTSELELGNIKRENARLHAYVTSLEKRLDDRDKLTVAPVVMTDDEVKRELDDLNTRFALVCKSLWLVLDHFKAILTADADGQRIIDLAATTRSKKVVVNADTAAPFFEWLLLTKGIGK